MNTYKTAAAVIFAATLSAGSALAGDKMNGPPGHQYGGGENATTFNNNPAPTFNNAPEFRPTILNTPVNAPVAHGGQGGKGGDGGNAASSAKAYQGQEQGQAQGQLQGQAQGQSADNKGNAQALTLQQSYSADPGRNNTPSIGMGGLYPSAPCMGTSNVGGSGPGLSLGFGTSWESKPCNIREAARIAPTEADKLFVWCTLEEAAGAPSCVKLQAQKKAEAATVAEQSDKRKTSGERTMISGVQQPVTCVSDEYVARRMGTAVCK